MGSKFQDLDDFWPLKIKSKSFYSLISTICADDFLFSASMIVMAQAIMKIFSMLSLTRMILMVQDTQIAGRELFLTKNEHKPLSRLIKNDFFLRNPETGNYTFLRQQELLENKEIFDPKFS